MYRRIIILISGIVVATVCIVLFINDRKSGNEVTAIVVGRAKITGNPMPICKNDPVRCVD